MGILSWFSGLFTEKKRQYEAALNSDARTFGNIGRSAVSPNTDLKFAASTLRLRSVDVYQNTATGRAAVEALVAHVVGQGIDIEPDTGIERRDAALHEAWRMFCECASVCGRFSLEAMQRQAMRSVALGGASLWQIVSVDDGRPVPVGILSYDIERLSDNPADTIAEGNLFCNGIESDKMGRLVAVHILPADANHYGYHKGQGGKGSVPGSPLTPTGDLSYSGKPVRILADDIIYAFEPQRPGQFVGEPMLAPVLERIKQEEQLHQYELTAAKTGAAVAVAIVSDDDGSLLSNSDNADANGDGSGSVNYPSIDMAPGTIVKLMPGDDIRTVANNRPSQQVAPFSAAIRGGIAAAMRLRSVDLDKNYATANYSSMRSAQLDMRRHMEPLQQTFGRFWAKEVYLRILPMLSLIANHPIPSQPTMKARYCRCKIMPSGFPYVDPVKDIQGSIESIRAGLSTWQDELQGRGKDPRQVLARLKSELEDEVLSAIFNQKSTTPEQQEPKQSKVVDDDDDEDD